MQGSVDKFIMDEQLVQLNKKKTRNRLIGLLPCFIGNVIVLLLLLCIFIYSKRNNSFISSNYLSLKADYDKSRIENAKLMEDIELTTKQKEEIIPEFQKVSNELKEIYDKINHYLDEMSNTKKGIITQKEKVQNKLDELYTYFSQLSSEMILSSSNLNEKLFPFNKYKYEIEGKEYTSTIIKSIDEVKFIEEATGYKLGKPCFQSLHHRLIGRLFQSYCSDGAPTISLYFTDKHNRFGGYTTLSWSADGDTDVYDKDAKLINLDSRKVWKSLPEHKTIKRDTGLVPSFGEQDIKCSSNGKCTINQYFECFERNEKEYEINGGHSTFTILSVEVFGLVKP